MQNAKAKYQDCVVANARECQLDDDDARYIIAVKKLHIPRTKNDARLSLASSSPSRHSPPYLLCSLLDVVMTE